MAFRNRESGDLFSRIEVLLLKLAALIILFFTLAKFVWSEAAPLLNEIFHH